jgi:hypothetical protein
VCRGRRDDNFLLRNEFEQGLAVSPKPFHERL